MDEYLDQMLSSASWGDMSGVGSGGGPTNGMPGDSHSQLPLASIWCQSYNGGFPSVPLILGEEKSEAVHKEEHILGKRSHGDEELIVTENRSATTEHDSLHGTLLTSYTGAQVHRTPLSRSAVGQPNQQMLHSGQGNSVEQYGNHSIAVSSTANGAVRQRIRARRGQATDPHSIAERLRRERIAERMRSLQELIPNSNKTDKASMLDEIIEYVKFLQLQVKVLSMSRLGGAGAIAPLIADVPSEVCGSLISPAIGQADGPFSRSQDGLDFEQEVAKLMESNMTTAMQYLQNKGLCLMPIALANAISSSNVNPLPVSGTKKSIESTSDRQISELQPAVCLVNSSSEAVGLGAAASSGTDRPLKDNSGRKDGEEVAVSTKSESGAPGLSSKLPKAGLNSKEEPPW